MRCKIAKAAYDKRRREEKREALCAYDVERNRIRRADPEYAAAQKIRKDEWKRKNRERHLAKNREYDQNSLRSNIQRRISKNLRHRVSKAAKGITRGGSAVALLGIPIDQFQRYLESLFSEGMTWDNYGQWHIDHRKPLILFDLSREDECMLAFNYKNLQPLWAKDNRAKWASYEERAK